MPATPGWPVTARRPPVCRSWRFAGRTRAGPIALPTLPADVLLLCGIFGNVSDDDIRRTVAAAPALCAAGGTIIWTRHRRAPDLTPDIRAWFGASGFDEVTFDALATSTLVGVGVNRLRHAPGTELPAGPLFTFGEA